MKTVIIGGVAAGTKTAAKLKREDPQAEVVIYTKSADISYAGCGLPYYIGGAIANEADLVVNMPEKFMQLTGAKVHTRCEVVALHAAEKTITVVGETTETVSYDHLVIAVGAEPIVPPLAGVTLPGVFTVRTPADAIAARRYLEDHACRHAVVVGGGFIGLEVAENLREQQLSVTLVDQAPQLMPNVFDHEMAEYVRRRLQGAGMRVLTGTKLERIEGDACVTAVQTGAGVLPADLVILAVGIRPATDFLKTSGLKLERGCIVTDENQQTNLPDIYAVGDCALVRNRITGKPQWSAMGSTANIAGRALAQHLAGRSTPYAGCIGTGVVRLASNLQAGRTGLTEVQAREAGYSVETVVCVQDDKAHYYPGASFFVTKLVADADTHRLLGLQVIGAGAVDKMTDIAVVGISAGLRLEEFVPLDFSYAPPFSTAIHPFAAACGILLNKLEGCLQSITPAAYAAGAAAGYHLVDAHPAPTLPGAEWLNLADLAGFAAKHACDEKLLLVCARGKRGYLLQNKLRALGFEQTRVLEGGATCSVIRRTLPAGAKLPPEEIKRVKGLGCLRDKRFDDVFNVRVITRNGKITAAEARVISEAAEQFGSGEVTMTTRLTMEIQGVKYEKIDTLIAFLAQHGLETGGTGSLVRPVVSCKGTTCQFGLIDTFALSQTIHERFYQGYHGVTLPHKFKIAIGGCPNNCVKPDLNDLGIIGQRVPLFDYAKCRGCKVCQVEKACPIQAATLAEGMLKLDGAACNGCGRCKAKCPFGVTEDYTEGYRIYIGGRWGKKMANGRPLGKLFTSEEEVLEVVERAILFFRDEGKTGERFADTVNRLGFAYVEDRLLNGTIEKSAILEKKVTGGATC